MAAALAAGTFVALATNCKQPFVFTAIAVVYFAAPGHRMRMSAATGFAFWIAGNVALSVVFSHSNQFALIALHALYSAIQIYSFISWSRADQTTAKPVAAPCKCDTVR